MTTELVPLGIGNQGRAIQLMASFTEDPRKIVAELLANAMDEGARHVKMRLTTGKGGTDFIIQDDGRGFRPSEGKSGLQRIAENIANSDKVNLTDKQRENVAGKFGVALLGAMRLGDVEIMTKHGTNPAEVATFTLTPTPSMTPPKPVHQHNTGSIIVIQDLKETTVKRLKFGFLKRFLDKEIGQRIRDEGVRVELRDDTQDKDGLIEYQRPDGKLIKEIKKIRLGPLGDAVVEFYLVDPNKRRGRVSIVEKGTVIIDDISTKDEFNKSPWNLGRIEGIINGRSIEMMPNRKDIATDSEFYIQLVKALEPVGEQLRRLALQDKRKREDQRAKQLESRMRDVLSRAKPSFDEKYEWFQKDDRQHNKPPTPRKKAPEGAKIHRLELLPKKVILEPGAKQRFRVQALDIDGNIVSAASLNQFYWDLEEAQPIIAHVTQESDQDSNNVEVITTGHEGITTLQVGALDGENYLDAKSVICVDTTKARAERKRIAAGGVPSLRYERVKDGPRSRYEKDKNTLFVNAEHEDFKRISNDDQALLSYYAALATKTFVLINKKQFKTEEDFLDAFAGIMATLRYHETEAAE